MTGKRKGILWAAALAVCLGGTLFLAVWAGLIPMHTPGELDGAIGPLLLEQVQPGEDAFVCESHTVIGSRSGQRETRVYAWVTTLEASCRADTLCLRRETHAPVILTLRREESGMETVSCWQPEEGADEEEAIRKAFPWYLARRALRLREESAGQRLECLRQAEEHFGVALATPYLNRDWADEETDGTVPDTRLVLVTDYIPDAVIELRYATENNFTGRVIYDFAGPSLRYGTVRKLARVQEELKGLGYGLKIWDAYRPLEAHQRLWEVNPDPTYVSAPSTGTMSHSRGSAVDVTLVYPDGREAEMPSEFDAFSALADRDYSDVSETAAKNARLLEEIMEKHGFKGYIGEWYHYADTQSYPVIEESPLA